jgi:quercetin dioxygenase-like cupin family protein
MANPTLEVKAIGKLQCSVYVFANTGDELPMHVHEEGASHITIVNRGSLKAYSTNGWEKVLNVGQIVVFAPHDPHAFVALEDDCKITNIIY